MAHSAAMKSSWSQNMDQKSGSAMSAVDGAAVGAYILSCINPADMGKENVQLANVTTEERDDKNSCRRARKRKARSRQNEAGPLVGTAIDVTNAIGTSKMCKGNFSSESRPEHSSDCIQHTGNSKERCSEIIEKLQSTCKSEQHEQLVAVVGSMLELSRSKHGTWVAQTALEVATGSDRDALIAAIQDHVVELYECAFGNYVLSKAIEVLPRNKVAFIVSALLTRGTAVAKHRFGCRIVCRLLEHCSEEELGGLFQEFICDAEVLARDQYGNYIIQSLLEHAYSACGTALLQKLLPCAPQLAQHRYGSLVVQRLLDYSDWDSQKKVISELMWQPSEGDKSTLVEVACTRYGSFVVEQLAKMKVTHHHVRDLLQKYVALLQASEHGQRVIDAFALSQNVS